MGQTIFYERKPKPPLDAYIDIFWIFTGEMPAHCAERLLPTATVEIVINLEEDTSLLCHPRWDSGLVTHGGSLLVGPQAGFFYLATQRKRSVAGVHFKPGGILPFLDLPASEIRDLHIPLADIWGRSGACLRERVVAARGVEAKLDRLEEFLRERLVGRFQPHRAVDRALHALFVDFDDHEMGPEMASVRKLAQDLGLSERRLRDLFGRQVGLSPKYAARISRFQRVIAAIERAQRPDWSDIALRCGFFDQAHLIGEFRTFSGLSPSRYLARRGPHTNHIPMDDDEVEKSLGTSVFSNIASVT